MTDIRTLHDAFTEDRRVAEKAHLGHDLTVEATVLRAGRSMYSTPVIEASDRPGGDLLAVFVLPYGTKINASFRQLRSVRRGEHISITGECRMLADDNILVFKNCVIEKK